MKEDLDAITEFEKWRAGEPINLLEDDTLICECMCVSVLDIRESHKDSKVIDLKILKEELSMGQGCSSCLKTINEWKDRIF